MRYLSFFFYCSFFAVLSCSRPTSDASSTATTETTAQTSPASPTATKIEPAATGATGATDCGDQFYYYNQEKITLKMKPHFLIVAFQPGLSLEAKTKILKQFPEYETATQEQTTDVAPFQVVKFRTGTTCPQLMPISAKLEAAPEVLYANPVFNAPAAMGGGTAWIGVTSEFLVNIKSAAQASALKAFAAQTKTKIVDELGETTFLLQATKNSQGNALEMANLFHTQPFVSGAEPDFYIAAQTGGLQKK